jgi:hypothetical protein
MIDMGTLGGFPNPPALWLRQAKPASANAMTGAGARHADRVSVGESVFVGGTRTARSVSGRARTVPRLPPHPSPTRTRSRSPTRAPRPATRIPTTAESP